MSKPSDDARQDSMAGDIGMTKSNSRQANIPFDLKKRHLSSNSNHFKPSLNIHPGGNGFHAEIPQRKDGLPFSAAMPFIQIKDGRVSMGEVIRLLRKEKGFTQEGLSRKAQVDRTTIARIECGIFQSLSMLKLQAIATALEIDLNTMLLKSNSMGEVLTCRGDVGRVEFTLEYPEHGFRILSLIPKRKEFFFGKIEIGAQKTILSPQLPHPEQIYLHPLEGKILLTRQGQASLLKIGEYFAFSGLSDYELYNPDQLKQASALFITSPSFLTH